jgi:hypothetical protein
MKEAWKLVMHQQKSVTTGQSSKTIKSAKSTSSSSSQQQQQQGPFVRAWDIRAIMKKFGIEIAEDECAELIAQYDKAGKGSLNYEEFVNL